MRVFDVRKHLPKPVKREGRGPLDLLVGFVIYVVIQTLAGWVAVHIASGEHDWKAIFHSTVADALGGGEHSHLWTNDAMLCIGYPLMLIASVTAIASRKPPMRSYTSATRRSRLRKYYDRLLSAFTFRSMAFFWIVVPFGARIYLNTMTMWDSDGMVGITSHNIVQVAKSWGQVALLAMGIFLVTVSKHSPILRYFQWDPSAAMVLHMATSYIAIVASIVHGGLYFIKFKDVEKARPLYKMLIPPLGCWFGDTKTYQPECGSSEREDCTCHNIWVSFYGVVALFAICLIAITSLEFVRRHFYKSIFYVCHVIMSPLMFWMLLLHWKHSAYYLIPGIVIYGATALPNVVESNFTKNKEGVLVESVEQTSPDAGLGTICLAIEINEASVQRYSPGQYVNLYVPSINWMKSHPFSAICHEGKLHLLMKVQSRGFTADLAAALRFGKNPKMVLDGFYGSQSKLNDALRHDVITFVAGGVGLSAFVDIATQLCLYLKHMPHDSNRHQPKVILHWLCRDRELIEYGKRELLDTVMAGDHVAVYIHDTSRSDYVVTPAPKKIETEHSLGCAFDSSLLTFGLSETWLSNVPFFIMFSVTCWVGTLLWVSISQGSREDMIYYALQALILVYVVTVSYLSIRLGLCNGPFKHYYSSLQMNDGACVGDDDEEEGAQSVANYESKGRPFLDLVLGPMVREAEDPGLFLCGSKSMIKFFRRAARRKSRNISVYVEKLTINEDKFEL